MPTFSISMTKVPEFPDVSFTEQQMRTLAGDVQEQMRARILRGVNLSDAPAKPLSERYAKRKQRRGRAPIRDWTFTGDTMRNLKIMETSKKSTEVGFDWRAAVSGGKGRPGPFQKALFQQNREPMFGLSPQNEQAVGRKVAEIFESNVKGAGR